MTEKVEDEPHIVSIKTVHQEKPIKDVEVYLQTNSKYIFVCKTNEKGSCLSPLPKFNTYTLIAKKSGYANLSIQVKDNKKTRFRLNLEKGNDITIQTLISIDGKQRKLKNTKIYLNRKFQGKTNEQGIFVKSLDQEIGEIIDLKIEPSDKGLTPFKTSIVYSSAIDIKKVFPKVASKKIELSLLQISITGKNINFNIDNEFEKLVKNTQKITKNYPHIKTRIVEKLNAENKESGFFIKPTIFADKNTDIQFELYDNKKQVIFSTRTSLRSRTSIIEALKEVSIRATNHTVTNTIVTKINGNKVYFKDPWNMKNTYNNRDFRVSSFSNLKKGYYADSVIYKAKMDTNKSNSFIVKTNNIRKKDKSWRSNFLRKE